MLPEVKHTRQYEKKLAKFVFHRENRLFSKFVSIDVLGPIEMI